MILYVGGILQSQIGFFNGPIGVSQQKLNLGRSERALVNFYCDAGFSEFRIWNVVRTEDEIKKNMNIRLNGSETGIVGCCKAVAELLTANNDTPPSTAQEVVSGFVAAHPKFAAKLSSGLDEEMVTYLEKLSEQLFGQPVSKRLFSLTFSLARLFSSPLFPSPLLSSHRRSLKAIERRPN